jgi:hypothetical protein
MAVISPSFLGHFEGTVSRYFQFLVFILVNRTYVFSIDSLQCSVKRILSAMLYTRRTINSQGLRGQCLNNRLA